MGKKSQFEVGKEYTTRGGWKALVIYKSKECSRMYAVHTSDEGKETGPILHDSRIGTAMDEFAMHPPAAFNGHPADIMVPGE